MLPRKGSILSTKSEICWKKGVGLIKTKQTGKVKASVLFHLLSTTKINLYQETHGKGDLMNSP